MLMLGLVTADIGPANLFLKDLVNTGNIRIAYMTCESKLKEMEVVVQFLE